MVDSFGGGSLDSSGFKRSSVQQWLWIICGLFSSERGLPRILSMNKSTTEFYIIMNTIQKVVGKDINLRLAFSNV